MTNPPTAVGGSGESIDRLIARRHLDEAEAALCAQRYAALPPDEQAEWNQRRGFIACLRGQHAAALAVFREALHAFPDSWKLRFGEAQDRGHTGDIEGMFHGFESLRFPDVPAEIAMAQARYAFLFRRQEEGIAALRPVLDVILELRIGDSTFLAIRGLPDTEDAWAALGAFYEESGRVNEFAEVTERVVGTMYDIDAEAMRRFLACVQTGDFTPEIERLWPAPRKTTKRPNPYLAMRAACMSEMTASPSVRNVDDVNLEPSDEYPNYRWLEDVRTLVHAERARRRGDQATCAASADAVLRAQPILFEPWLAFSFRLANAQAHLLARAQANFAPPAARA